MVFFFLSYHKKVDIVTDFRTRLEAVMLSDNVISLPL